MKKLITAIVAIVVATTLALSLTACGASPEEKLKTYIESESFQSELDSLKTAFGSTLGIDVNADENKLVFEFTYNTQISNDLVDSVKEQLDTSFNAMSSTFENIANQLKSEVGIENPVVVIKILNSDKTTITELEFEATE